MPGSFTGTCTILYVFDMKQLVLELQRGRGSKLRPPTLDANTLPVSMVTIDTIVTNT